MSLEDPMIPRHNPLDLVAELAPLMDVFPGKATRGWLSKTAWRIWELEVLGPPHFGGPDVLAWWLVQRCKPKAPPTKAKAKRLIQMAGGSQKTLDLLVQVAEERSKPNRLGCGWTFMQVNSYLSARRAERLAC